MKYAYKVICALLAITVIGILFFAPIIGVRIQSETASIVAYMAAQRGDEDVLNKMEENGGEIPEHISETTSLYDLAFGDTGAFFSGLSTYFDIDENKNIEIIYGSVLAFAVSIGAVALSAVAVMVFGIFAKNNRKVIYSSVAGLGSYYMMIKCFAVIEDIFVSGRLKISDIILEWWSSLIGNIVNFELLEPLSFIPVVFAGVIIWTLLYNYTLTPQQKRERKLMLGEAD